MVIMLRLDMIKNKNKAMVKKYSVVMYGLTNLLNLYIIADQLDRKT